MIKEIFLVRHGETDYNRKMIVQGRGVNSSINETGWQQARAFYEKYKSYPFDILYTSSLTRTHQTMHPFIESGISHIATQNLDEIDWGIYEGVGDDPNLFRVYSDIMKSWRGGDLHVKIDKGESPLELATRQQYWIDEIKQSPHQKILACSHGRSIRALLCQMTDLPLSKMDDFPHTNTCLYKLVWDKTRFEIELFNDISHLNG
jgi:probable phosphoglycerate mutase